MQFIYSYVKNICIFTLVITLILNIFPDKKYVKYIKLFAGFLMIWLIFQPVLNIKENEMEKIEKIISEYTDEKNYSEINERADEIITKMYERMNSENGTTFGN